MLNYFLIDSKVGFIYKVLKLFADKHCQFVLAENKSALTGRFAKIEHFCTTADAWKARSKAYLGVTAHYICPSTLKRESLCLAISRMIRSITYDVIGKKT